MAATIDVNVANQAYPPPPPGSQGLPVPSAVEVEAFPFVQPSLSLGTAQAQAPTVNIQNFSAVLSPATTQDVIVTENGNFATNNQTADVQTFTVAAIPFASVTTTANFTQPNAVPNLSPNVTVAVTDTSWMTQGQVVAVATGGLYLVEAINSTISVTLTNLGLAGNAAPTTVILSGSAVSGDVINQGVYKITLNQNGQPAKLSSFGVDFTQLFASFPNAAQAANPENVPSRQISAYNDPNTIVVPVQDSFGNNLYNAGSINPAGPSIGDTVTIGIVRQGASLTINTINEIDVTIAPSPPAAVTAPAIGNLSLGNVSPSPIGLPFIGSGVGAPPFLGTFEVENQIPLGKGLPANVFV